MRIGARNLFRAGVGRQNWSASVAETPIGAVSAKESSVNFQADGPRCLDSNWNQRKHLPDVETDMLPLSFFAIPGDCFDDPRRAGFFAGLPTTRRRSTKGATAPWPAELRLHDVRYSGRTGPTQTVRQRDEGTALGKWLRSWTSGPCSLQALI